jgi:hypothetical protein
LSKNTKIVTQTVFDFGLYHGPKSIKISGGFRGVIAPPFKENFSIFPSKNERKMSSYYTNSNEPQKYVFALNRSSLRKSRPPPFQNPRSATDKDFL